MRHSLILAALTCGVSLAATPALAESGPRVEALVGWDRISLDEGRNGLGTYSKNGLAYGGAVGYDWSLAPLVSVGVDGEVDGSTARYRFGGANVTARRDLYVGARATLAVSPITSIYGKVGYANGGASVSVPGFTTDGNRDGVRLGVGVHQSLAPHIYGLLEYRYTNYKDNFSRNQLMTGLGFRF